MSGQHGMMGGECAARTLNQMFFSNYFCGLTFHTPHPPTGSLSLAEATTTKVPFSDNSPKFFVV